MTTLGALKAEIADDMARSDLSTQVASAIASAIDHYKSKRFFFNETRTLTFPTVAAQSTYTVSDNSNIPLFAELDDVFLSDSAGKVYPPLNREMNAVDLENLLDTSAASGRPYCYGYYEQSFRFYPVPDAVYTIRPVGLIEKAAPSADDDTGNVWMTHGYQLIRSRAKVYIYSNTIHDDVKAGVAAELERNALSVLRERSASKIGSGMVARTYF